ncbi:MAG: hypothetical protein CL903_05635 [Dehalococcoidia bacterium]|nr:hypothetical protein [Dehalococcoidia bacterium]
MKVLLVGGSGMVGSFITPYLIEKNFTLKVLDIKKPKIDIEWINGSIDDPNAINQAVKDIDAFIWLAMQSPQGGSNTHQDVKIIQENYFTNCLGLHTFLWLAQEKGISKGIYTSSMSVHYRERKYFPTENMSLDTPSVYGLSKGFGEKICQYFSSWFDMNIIALRITGPRKRNEYIKIRDAKKRIISQEEADRLRTDLYVTDEEDLANAYILSLDKINKGHGRFDPIFIAGDENEEEHNLTKAKQYLGWQPKSHIKYLSKEKI